MKSSGLHICLLAPCCQWNRYAPHLGQLITTKTKKVYKRGPGLSVYPYTQEAEADKAPRETVCSKQLERLPRSACCTAHAKDACFVHIVVFSLG